MALAAIGLDTLPLPLQQRSIIVRMRRADGERQLRQFDATTDAALRALGCHLLRWARNVAADLNLNPALPPVLKNRAADNWRPLISIADACGAEWGQEARMLAVAMCGKHADEDLGVTLLHDIRAIFNRAGADRMTSRDLVDALIALDDGVWSEWRGRQGTQQPRLLSRAQLTQLLRPFGIHPRSLWRGPRRPHGKCAKGYYRVQFEQAWGSYCASPSSQSAPSVLRVLDH